MEEHVNKLLDLLRKVEYIKDERVNVQIFLGCFPMNCRDKIEVVNPPSLSESIGMEIHCYEKRKGKLEAHK